MSAISNENFVRSEKTSTFQVGGTDKTRGPRESLYDRLNSPKNVLDQLANAVWRFDTALRSEPNSDWFALLFHPDPYDASCPTVQTADRLRVMRDRLTAPKHRWRIHREDFDDWWDRRDKWQASIDSGTYTEDMVCEQMAALESCLDEYRGGGSVMAAELETIGKQLRQLRQSLAEPSSPQWTATSVLSAITGTALTAYLGYRAYTWMTGDE